MKPIFFPAIFLASSIWAQTPILTLVANAEGENPTIAPNTWVEIKGSNLSKAGDSRIWQTGDFAKNQLPTALDGVSVTVNGKSAYVYYISPTQVNILTPPDAMQGSVDVVLTNNGSSSVAYLAQAQPISPSFFVFNGGPYIAATHVDGALLGPTSLYPGSTTPAKPGETVVLYANGFGPTSTPVVSGSEMQAGTLSPLPVITIGGISAHGARSPGSSRRASFSSTWWSRPTCPAATTWFWRHTMARSRAGGGRSRYWGRAPAPSSVTFYVAPNGNDFWCGTLAAPNAGKTDGPFATFDHARAIVQSISKAGLTGSASSSAGGRTICRRR